jgi:peptidoglycan hydrolase-like protein with peptidoglycan-binding domain
MDRSEFINSIKDGAIKGYTEYRILPSLTIAQAILESGWGSSQLAQRAKNLFGIKAFSNWRGERITLSTTEWYGDQTKIINADFRAYDSFNESIEDHNKLLTNSRYEPVRVCSDYREACRKIYESGYATDPAYPEKLINIIEENKLYEYDNVHLLSEVTVAIEANRILKFQQLCNRLSIKDYEEKALIEDNKLGPRTKSCIAKMPNLMIGSSGLAVQFIQETINAIPIDGSFGPVTKNCVMEYQESKNIDVDGIVGIQTWTASVTT